MLAGKSGPEGDCLRRGRAQDKAQRVFSLAALKNQLTNPITLSEAFCWKRSDECSTLALNSQADAVTP